jgi:hypothetical protein
MARMDDEMPWFAELSAEDRSWVGVIVQAGIKSFVDWYADEAGTRSSTAPPWPPRSSARARGPWPA